MTARELSYREAINEALRLEMRRDPTVILMGEDVTGASHSSDPAALDAWGGVLGVTKGLVQEFGRERVRDAPAGQRAERRRDRRRAPEQDREKREDAREGGPELGQHWLPAASQ